MSKLIELVERVENEFNSNEHKTLQNMYGMPESIKRIITLTKIIRLQHSALEKSIALVNFSFDGCEDDSDYEPETVSGEAPNLLCGKGLFTIEYQDYVQKTLEETNRIAEGE